MSYVCTKRYEIADKKIAIFGAGRSLQFMCEKYLSSIEVLAHCCCFIDNDPIKQGKTLYMKGFAIPCVSFEEYAEKIHTDNSVVLISLWREVADKVISQIDSYDNGAIGWDFLRATLADPVPYNLNTEPAGEKPLIPKTIHYCWFGGNPIPDHWQKCIDSWSKFCPDYEIVRWDESNYDVKKHPFLKRSYDAGLYAFSADFARTDIIYQNGGFYVDIDVELIKSLDLLRHNELYYGFEFTLGLNNGLGFGGIKGHPLLAENLTYYDCFNVIESSDSVNPMCQIFLITDQMQKLGFRMDNTYQSKNGVTLYPSDVLAPCIVGQPEICLHTTENTHSIHRYASTHEKKLTDLRTNQTKNPVKLYNWRVI
jgi:hypothetical protein